jgi:hypothetical protein
MFAMWKSVKAGALVASLLVAACAGPELIGMNSNLTRLADEKQSLDLRLDNAPARDREKLATRALNVDGELERLTDAAYQAARNTIDTKAKISYYRIAATAGWQRGDLRTIQITQEGTAVCNQSNGFDLSPRDCVMLLAIPNLAVADSWARKMDQVKADKAAQPAGLVSRWAPTVYDLLDSLDGLAQAAAKVKSTEAPPRLADLIIARRAAIGGNIGELGNFILRGGGGPSHFEDGKKMCDAIRARPEPIVPPECNQPQYR